MGMSPILRDNGGMPARRRRTADPSPLPFTGVGWGASELALTSRSPLEPPPRRSTRCARELASPTGRAVPPGRVLDRLENGWVRPSCHCVPKRLSPPAERSTISYRVLGGQTPRRPQCRRSQPRDLGVHRRGLHRGARGSRCKRVHLLHSLGLLRRGDARGNLPHDQVGEGRTTMALANLD